MSRSSRPSSKGYTPVPTSERIDDDVDSPQHPNEEADNDGDLYSTPLLLSSRTRGTSPPGTPRRSPWYANLKKFNPFRRDRFSTWSSEGSKSPITRRRILIFGFSTFTFLVVLGLSIATGLLARALISTRDDLNYCWSRFQYRERWTRIAKSPDRWRSYSGLNFPAFYPPLRASKSPACQAAWNTLRSVPCHEKIWNRSWDNGKRTSIFDPDIGLYANTLCQSSCKSEIERAWGMVSFQCNEDDKFDMENYNGPFTLDAEIEDGPVAAMRTIAQRLAHTCRPAPKQDKYRWQSPSYCVTVLWEDWGIVDGMNAGNLEGLAAFSRKTSVSRIESSQYRNEHLVRDTCDDVNAYDQRWVPARKLGPREGETQCGLCILNWLERKALSWDENLQDSATGKQVSLKEFLEKVGSAGKRCEKDEWEKVWNRVQKKYKGKEDGKSIQEDVGTEEEDGILEVYVTEGFGRNK